MSLWFLLALMTAAAVFAVLWPLGRRVSRAPQASEAVVYQDQLAEVTRDAEAGLIGPVEAEAARVEISRRLLAATDHAAQAAPTASRFSRRAVSIVALIGVPLLAIGLYLQVGSPSLPDFPLAARKQTPQNASLESLVAQVQGILEKNPTDGRGWNVLAPVLFKLGRFNEAVQAYRNSLTYNGETAGRHSDLGEAMTAVANGVVTAEAKAEFDRALALDPNEAKARYFTGLALEQDGQGAKAADIWRDMLAKAPADATWRPLVQEALARVSGPRAPALSNEQMAAVQGMAAGDQKALIEGMVERLAGRLKTNKDDVEGWLRLVRAYMVLGDKDKAQAAREEARQALTGTPEHLRQLNDGLKGLGLDG
ncbi:cytochrome c-type biogenesis protein CycH [Afipia carboxidovorans OM5]|uniref:Cytochrome c-type biogenesis protein CycH n=1 Tax=Afipia carboxidovorans (strain ATCC 49405 / DSM 1227 / KCTC 32145 / OM5) TaxID=504832 RepID=B6JFE0_AFIC5|nr:c-type cytochrome biogenesis protein CcmI [Afipia carboxidovorans]ACI93688.1 cytochrome c-type biogenesis protein CycH [Afipia carboxidovorans OM5]AEI02626.1 cytochrome c-type biogenesis protein CycH [Afipia carboxidovorans OM4]AEI06202.1 cytochrome c-type biogenesis protein CycH [Afipia carboxidovorans OM5]